MRINNDALKRIGKEYIAKCHEKNLMNARP